MTIKELTLQTKNARILQEICTKYAGIVKNMQDICQYTY